MLTVRACVGLGGGGGGGARTKLCIQGDGRDDGDDATDDGQGCEADHSAALLVSFQRVEILWCGEINDIMWWWWGGGGV